MSFNIQSELSKPILCHKPANLGGVSSTINSDVKAGTGQPCQNVQLKDVPMMASGSEIVMDKPSLKASQFPIHDEQMFAELSVLTDSDKLIVLNDLNTFKTLTTENIQQAIGKVLTEEKSHIDQLMGEAQLPDEADLKQMSQAIQVLIGSSFFKDLSSERVDGREVKNDEPSIDGIRKDTFVGIISSDLMMELTKIIRQVMREINISDRRISADFLQLNAKMVQASADATIREGKEMFKGALMGFFTSLAITAAGTAFQARGLRQQHQSIKNNLIPGNKNLTGADKLSGLTSKIGANSPKSNILSVSGKDGSTVRLNNQATQNQKNIANQKTAEAGQRTKDLGLSEHEQHEKIMNKSRVQMGMAEQASRLSDNAGQLATSGNQVNVKAEEANKSIAQSVADIARTISADKDKQVDKSQDLVKQMQEHLREIRESTLRSFQSVVRG
ncbi:TPA: type III secretion target, IpaC/SipC family protein [Providencia rettgeri]|uniref:type III secretion target, IpaC/SipC family protein n=1 Tax=Providencia sp. PROV129 TaxID=2949839 RepID=UPI00234A4ECC|nr:type III secretion target, IpaC/SipC family protein [Providencia sp. PROV129]HEC8327988.1 type III secretion target, IpaC/SipC family protein [Providencia rettgeri]